MDLHLSITIGESDGSSEGGDADGVSGGETPPDTASEGSENSSLMDTSSAATNSDNSSSSEEINEEAISTTAPGSSSSLIGTPNLELLRCPVCMDFPRKNIYQCSNGHSICNRCLDKVDECCICRVKYDDTQKTRNLLVESLLDAMQLNCEYKDKGCPQKLHRTQMSWHESQCFFNNNSLKLSLLFGESRMKSVAKTSEMLICPKTLLTDKDYGKVFVEHMSKPPLYIPFKQVVRGEKLSMDFHLPIQLTVGKDHFFPVSLMELVTPETKVSLGYFALIQRVSVDNQTKQFVLSWTVLGFTGRETMNRLQHPMVSFLIKSNQKNGTGSFGRGTVANLTWFLEAVDLDDWKEFVSQPNGERPPFPFSVPSPFLYMYYLDEFRNCRIEFVFI